MAALDAQGAWHAEAEAIWQRLLAERRTLLSSNYVLLETFALVQRRLGMEAVRTLEAGMVQLLDFHWLEPELHHRAV